MITIYKNKKDIPQNTEYIKLNDVFFNQNTVLKLDDTAKEIVEQSSLFTGAIHEPQMFTELKKEIVSCNLSCGFERQQLW